MVLSGMNYDPLSIMVLYVSAHLPLPLTQNVSISILCFLSFMTFENDYILIKSSKIVIAPCLHVEFGLLSSATSEIFGTNFLPWDFYVKQSHEML